MKTKVEIISDLTKIVNDKDVKDEAILPATLMGVLIALLDIRDILDESRKEN